MVISKDEAFTKYKQYEIYLANQYGRTIKIFRTDGGGEFVNAAFESHLKEKGTIHQTTCRYTPHQNGVAEKMNRTFMDKVRYLLIE